MNHLMPTAVTLDHLRRHAIARSLFRPTSLVRAVNRLGYLQHDPIWAPARTQDLVLRHRVEGAPGAVPGAGAVMAGPSRRTGGAVWWRATCATATKSVILRV